MLASLPMYLPSDNAAQALWCDIAGLLHERVDSAIPEALTWPQDLLTHWRDPRLLLSQTCGYPLTTALRQQVQVVGTFSYDVPGADGIKCTSQLIRRSDDARTTLAAFAGSCLAFNSTDSQSGFNALRALVSGTQPQQPFFACALETGGHNASIEAVRVGRADMAAIDCVTLEIWKKTNPGLSGEIAVFGSTDAYTGLPLITAKDTPAQTVDALRSSLRAVATEARFAAVRAPFFISGFTATSTDDYAVCLRMEQAGAPLFKTD